MPSSPTGRWRVPLPRYRTDFGSPERPHVPQRLPAYLPVQEAPRGQRRRRARGSGSARGAAAGGGRVVDRVRCRVSWPHSTTRTSARTGRSSHREFRRKGRGLSVRFGAQQRGACFGEKSVRRHVCAHAPGHTDAGRQRVAVQAELPVDVGDDAIDAILEAAFDDGALGVAAQDDELIALQTGQGVAAPVPCCSGPGPRNAALRHPTPDRGSRSRPRTRSGRSGRARTAGRSAGPRSRDGPVGP